MLILDDSRVFGFWNLRKIIPKRTEEPKPISIEEDLIHYCMNYLGMDFGTFWYRWEVVSQQNEYVFFIECDQNELENQISMTFKCIRGINLEKIHNIRKNTLNLPSEYKYEYCVSFRNEREIL